MEKSETIGKLSLALSKVQSKLRPAKENAKNPFFKSNYADLGSVWDAVRVLLAGEELAIIQMPEGQGDLTTVLSHSSGEWISSTLHIPSKNDAHGVGSAISYGRRYALASFIGVITGDDDGNGAVEVSTSSPKKKTSPKVKEALTDDKYDLMMKAIKDGKGVVVQQKLSNYNLTAPQKKSLEKALA
tara:strand:- start:104 stop:661 length:558 start_codon:yes stop_codon:yes gene_type:complete